MCVLIAQRSAQELPLVDRQSVDSCPATGGERMLISGHNFQPDSKVVFVEKGQGRKLIITVLIKPLLSKPLIH